MGGLLGGLGTGWIRNRYVLIALGLAVGLLVFLLVVALATPVPPLAGQGTAQGVESQEADGGGGEEEQPWWEIGSQPSTGVSESNETGAEGNETTGASEANETTTSGTGASGLDFGTLTAENAWNTFAGFFRSMVEFDWFAAIQELVEEFWDPNSGLHG